MYVMCLFQQLPSSNIIIQDKEKNDTSTTTTTITNDNNNATEAEVCYIYINEEMKVCNEKKTIF
jgi:hypothetical protein